MRALILVAGITLTLLAGSDAARADTPTSPAGDEVARDLHPALVWSGRDLEALDLALTTEEPATDEATATAAPGMPALHIGLSHADGVALALKIAPNKLWAGFVYCL